MIRRDWNITTDTPEWLLFSQPEHARVSWQLASAWQMPDAVAVLSRDDVLAAVRAHDDGWKTWESEPQVDAQGRPIAFDEMPLADSLAIWTDSIELGAQKSPLVGYAIAGHFVALLERFDSWKRDSGRTKLANDFLFMQSERMSEMLRQWRGDLPAQNAKANAELAVGCVQFFDALSLWMLMAEQHDAISFRLNAGSAVTFDPKEPGLLVVEPWPFAEKSVWISANGRTIPMRRYESAEVLHDQPRHEIELNWEFQPK